MSQDRVAQGSIRQSCEHGDLHRGQDFTRADTKTGESKNAIPVGLNAALSEILVSQIIVLARITAAIGILNTR